MREQRERGAGPNLSCFCHWFTSSEEVVAAARTNGQEGTHNQAVRCAHYLHLACTVFPLLLVWLLCSPELSACLLGMLDTSLLSTVWASRL